uniref:Mesencephalic astrocyte-derived neurotrophic factor n=1 Tax=Labrus bergylta TaxID=56723 RepID=A0A3Q3FH18_9LABR
MRSFHKKCVRLYAVISMSQTVMCVSFLGKFYQSLTDNNVKFTSADIENAIVRPAKMLKAKKTCYYIGATSDAATKMINEVSKPLSYHAPVEKICEKLKKKDMQICELKYGKNEVINQWTPSLLYGAAVAQWRVGLGESCKGCAEKSDFIRKITELMPKRRAAGDDFLFVVLYCVCKILTFQQLTLSTSRC